jgi:hypothetical protein
VKERRESQMEENAVFSAIEIETVRKSIWKIESSSFFHGKKLNSVELELFSLTEEKDVILALFMFPEKHFFSRSTLSGGVFIFIKYTQESKTTTEIWKVINIKDVIPLSLRRNKRKKRELSVWVHAEIKKKRLEVELSISSLEKPASEQFSINYKTSFHLRDLLGDKATKILAW